MKNEWENAKLYVEIIPEVAQRVVNDAGRMNARMLLKAGEIVGLKESPWWDVWGNEVESDIQLTPDKTEV